MRKPARLPRISISLMLLVIVPWAIVLIATLRISLLPDVPNFESKDAAEIAALAHALDFYAAEHGEYPPDFTSGNPRREIDEHLKKIYPDRDVEHDVPACIDNLGPDNALAFWLQGCYSRNTKYPLTGKVYVGRHPTTGEEIWIEMPEEQVMAEVHDGDSVAFMTSKGIIPIDGDVAAYQDLLSNYEDLRGWKQDTVSVLITRKPLHNFNINRLSNRGAYYPRCCVVPLVYFQAKNYSTAKFAARPEWGVSRPYQTVSADGKTDFAEPASFQIICSGRDGYFGSSSHSVRVTRAAYHQGHADNFANFVQQPLGTQQLIAARNQANMARGLSIVAALFCMLAYPFFIALSRHEDGLVALTRITTKQLNSTAYSDTWARKLVMYRRHRREQALERFRTKSRRKAELAMSDNQPTRTHARM